MLKFLVGLFTPRRISGLVKLKHDLKGYGVDPTSLGDPFLKDVVALYERKGNAFGQLPGRTAVEEFVRALDGSAARIATLVKPEHDPFSLRRSDTASGLGLPDPLRELFEKHHIPLP